MNNGKYGEWFFSYIMEQKGYTVENVSKNPEYYYKGDLKITSPFSGSTKIIEVKWDERIRDTNNLYLELTNRNSKEGQGWWTWCQADYLAYGDACGRKFYVFSLLELKERVKQLPERVGSCGEDSTGLLVSLEDIKDLYKELG